MFRSLRSWLMCGSLVLVVSATTTAQTTTLTRSVATGNDDAEECVPGGSGTVGAMDLTSSDLEIMLDGTKRQMIGIRFANITIPQGSVITNAYIQFASKGDKAAVSGNAVIRGEATDASNSFTATSFNVSTRSRTTDSVLWTGSTSTTWAGPAGTSGADQKTPDIKTVIQAIVNRAGWAGGNALSIIITGDGVRNAYSYDGSSTYAPKLVIEYSGPTTFTSSVISGADDAEECVPGGTGTVGSMDVTSSDLEIMLDGTKRQIIGARFTGINVPQGATISHAYIQFASKGDKAAVSGDAVIRGEATDVAATFSTTAFDITSRALTTDSVIWPGSTSTTWAGPAGTAGAEQKTPDIKNIIQAIVNRPGWSSGNALAIMLTGNGVRNAYSFDGSAASAPKLIIEYTYTLPPHIPTTNFPVSKLSLWSYLDDGTDQGTAWTSPSFVDSSWAFGPGKLGYSDNPATVLGYGPSASNKYITYYFRKRINVPSVAALNDTLELKVLRDDGAIVYINGAEVVRSNMPTGAVNYMTFSSTIVDGADESTYFSYLIPRSVLVNGVNTIAVEVHQRDGTSSDLGFDLELINYVAPPVPVQELLRGPYLVVGTPTSMNVRWRTAVAAKSVVRYGTAANALTSVVVDSANVTEHELKLTNLAPHTKYWYSIGSLTDTLQGDADNYFTTVRVAGDTSKQIFGVIGDCGNNSTNQKNVRDRVINYLGANYMDSWLLLGDNAYSSGTDAEFQAEFFNIYKDRFLKQNALYPAPGNHDYSNGSSARQNDHAIPYYSLFSMPTNGEAGGVPSNTQAFYSYDNGNVHFLSLDSYGKEDSATRLYDTTGAQVQWIKADLAANQNKGWVIAYWHHPPYTMGSHNSDSETELVRIRENFIRILERMGVDMILCGHSHDYERSKLMKGHYGNEASFNASTHNLSSSTGRYDGGSNSCPYIKDSVNNFQGTVYVVSGSAGQLGGSQAGYPHNALAAYSNATNGGAMVLEVQGNRLDAKWVCADGVVRDQFTLMKDINVKNTKNINEGDSVQLTASFNGRYSWTGASDTTKTIWVKPNDTTSYVVKDIYECVADTFTVNVKLCHGTDNASLPATSTNFTATQDSTGVSNYSADCYSMVLTIAANGNEPASGNITASVYVQNTAPSYLGQPYVRRHYDVSTATNPNTATATLTLYYSQEDFDDYNSNNGTQPDLPGTPTDNAGIANIRVNQHHGNSTTGLPGSYTGWTGVGSEIITIDPADSNIVWNSADNRWEVSFDVTGFSGFFLNSGGSTPLPVNLVSFHTIPEGAYNHISWKTANETKGINFAVERGNNGIDFKAINNQMGKGSGSSYNVYDKEPLSPIGYYRLKIQEPNGEANYSATVMVRRDAKNGVITISPIPATNAINIANTNEQLNGQEAVLSDIYGREMKRFTIQPLVVVDVAAWPSGNYMLRLPDGQTVRLVKQ